MLSFRGKVPLLPTRQSLVKLYEKGFYSNQRGGSLAAARRILPSVLQVVRPASVIDVGCGVGTWLAACEELAVGRRVGIEGNWVSSVDFLDESAELVLRDLEEPFRLDERFDLAISLEVAEHLSPARGESFVNDLCSLSNSVFFSAAVPGQGGLNHVHERWHDYWAAVFRSRSFRPLDIVRPRYWDHSDIPIHYRQNAFLYLHESIWEEAVDAAGALKEIRSWPMNLVHQEMHLNCLAERTAPPTLPQAIAIAVRLPLFALRSIRARLTSR